MSLPSLLQHELEVKQSSDSSDSECEVLKKIKASNDQNDAVPATDASETKKCELRNKKYNIWSDILLERQLTESLSKNVQLNGNNFKTSLRRSRKQRNVHSSKMGNEHKEQKVMTVRVFQPKDDKQVDNYNNPVNECNRKRKRMNTNRNANVNAGIESVVQMITSKLKEPKVHLIRKIVSVIGCRESTRLCTETLDVESAGGLMTTDGKRRRTPGGVFLTLLRASKKITEQQKGEIFAAEKQAQHKRKKAKKKNRNSRFKMEVSCSSDFNEQIEENKKMSTEETTAECDEAIQAVNGASECNFSIPIAAIPEEKGE